MRLSTFTDYSLRLLLYLAQAPEQRATIAEVAGAYAISANHLTKIVHLLGKEGILKNSRGRRGGVQLARPAAQINIGRVVRVTEGDEFPVDCSDCSIRRTCALIRPVHEAVEAFYATLGRYTLADLLRERKRGQEPFFESERSLSSL
jgi:Rrf2 family nitric oxide-sensitive transcriptional repressor